LAAYRIIQEGLTNAIRHAGPATAAVRLDYGTRELSIEVADTGRGVPGPVPAGPGHGLAGMRERAAAVGGVLQAGPAASGGFLVAARLPLGGQLHPGRPGPGGPASGNAHPGPGPLTDSAGTLVPGVGPLTDSDATAGTLVPDVGPS
ncbi:MAG: sensor histidine kinase, partial [Streptosporangiaceae bacterium]